MNQDFIELFGAKLARSQIVSVHEEKQVYEAIYRTVLIVLGLAWAIIIVGLFIKVEPFYTPISQFLTPELREGLIIVESMELSNLEVTLFFILPLIGFFWAPVYGLLGISWRLTRRRPVVVTSNTKLRGPYMKPYLCNGVTAAISSELEAQNENFNSFLAKKTGSFSFGSGKLEDGSRLDLTLRQYYHFARPVYCEVGPEQPMRALISVLSWLSSVFWAIIGPLIGAVFIYLVYASILYALDFDSIFFNSEKRIGGAFAEFFKYLIGGALLWLMAYGSMLFVKGWVFRDWGGVITVYMFTGASIHRKFYGSCGAFELKWLQAGLKEKLNEVYSLNVNTGFESDWDGLAWSSGGMSMSRKLKRVAMPEVNAEA